MATPTTKGKGIDMKNIKLVRGQTYSVNTGNGVVKFVKGEAQQVDDVVAVTLLSRTVVNADGEERPVLWRRMQPTEPTPATQATPKRLQARPHRQSRFLRGLSHSVPLSCSDRYSFLPPTG